MAKRAIRLGAVRGLSALMSAPTPHGAQGKYQPESSASSVVSGHLCYGRPPSVSSLPVSSSCRRHRRRNSLKGNN